MRSLGLLALCVGLTAASARADRVYLVDGAVIEGNARFAGDKVVIELDSGEITLDAREVERIEEQPSVMERYAALEAAEARRGIPGWMALADFCRAEGLRTREVHWLEKVISRDPEHAEARARLGYAKDHDGERWIKADELARERELADEQRRLAAHARMKAAVELETQKVALERERLKLERERDEPVPASEVEAPAQPSVATPYTVYGGYAHHAEHERCVHKECRRRRPAKRPFPIAGVRDPRDPSWRIPGVKDPLRER